MPCLPITINSQNTWAQGTELQPMVPLLTFVLLVKSTFQTIPETFHTGYQNALLLHVQSKKPTPPNENS